MGDLLDSFSAIIADDVGSLIKTGMTVNPTFRYATEGLGLWQEHNPNKNSMESNLKDYGNALLIGASAVPGAGLVKLGSSGAKAAAKIGSKAAPKFARDAVDLYKGQRKLTKSKKAYEAGKASGKPGWEPKHIGMKDVVKTKEKYLSPVDYLSGIPSKIEKVVKRPGIVEGANRIAARSAVKTARSERNKAAITFGKDIIDLGKTGFKATTKAAKRAKKRVKYYIGTGSAGQGIDFATDSNKQSFERGVRKRIR